MVHRFEAVFGLSAIRFRPSVCWGASFVAANGGIAAGVIIWAFMVEEMILKRFGVFPIYMEHNLFPFEIVALWVSAAVPLILGMGLGFGLSMRFGHRDLQ